MWNNVGFPYQDSGMWAAKMPKGQGAFEIKIVGREEDLDALKEEQGVEVFPLTSVCWKQLPK